MKNVSQLGGWKTFILVIALSLAACGGGDDDPIIPPASVQLAAVTLSGAQEVPAVVTTGSGNATVTVSADRSRIDFNVAFAGLSSGTTLAHIHIGPPGVSGPVIVNFALAPFTSPLTGTATAADLVPQPTRGINTFADAVAAILAGNTYINIHTVNNPTGEIRGALGPANLSATLTGAQEVPAVVTPGTGTATLVFDNLQTQIKFNVAFAGLSSGTTLAHIHVSPVGVSGPVIVNFALAPFTSPLTGTATAADFVPQPTRGINTFPDAVNAVMSGNAYVNVHTMNNLPGEIRGQLIGVLAPATSTTTLTTTTVLTTVATTVPGTSTTTVAPTTTPTTIPGTSTTTIAPTTTVATTIATTSTTTVAPACGSCHAIPPANGDHAFHVNSLGFACSVCHGAGYSNTTVNAATHINGTIELTGAVGWNAAARTCTNSCHGTRTW